ncbi:hypothetical protein ACROYT_G017366 [Oculina patagonica]
MKDAKSVERMFGSFPVPRVFKTHLTYDLIPKGSDETTKPRYIYVMRNPKDAFVSIYHHRRNMPYLKEIPTWDEAFEHFMNGRAGDVEKIAKFIGKDISPETRDLIVRQTSFGAMKSSNHTNYSWIEGMKGDGHIRKGKVGEWKNYFTEEQNQLFDEVFKEKMEGTGIRFECDG